MKRVRQAFCLQYESPKVFRNGIGPFKTRSTLRNVVEMRSYSKARAHLIRQWSKIGGSVLMRSRWRIKNSVDVMHCFVIEVVPRFRFGVSMALAIPTF